MLYTVSDYKLNIKHTTKKNTDTFINKATTNLNIANVMLGITFALHLNYLDILGGKTPLLRKLYLTMSLHKQDAKYS